MSIKTYLRSNITKDKRYRPMALWVFFSMIGVIAIKEVIRPMHLHLSPIGIFLQGTLPNFFAATGFCALGFLYYKIFFKGDPCLSKKLLFAFLFSFIGLTLWEYIQYFMGYPVDYYDILMSAIGSAITVIFIWLIYQF
jgi:hypothetical protein